MRRIIRAAPLAMLAMALADQGSAHHSPAQYDESIVVEKDSTVIRFEFRNPHSYILVRDSDGSEWMLETSSAVRLRRNGWNKDMFSPGDVIRFRANANRNPEKNRLYLNSVTDAAGETYTLLDDGEEFSGSATVATSLEGVWRVDTENFGQIYGGFAQHPLTDEALQFQDSYDEAMDPVAECIAYPTPQIVMVSFIYPMKIELSDEQVTFHHEFFDTKRTVFLDGRGHSPGTPRTNQGYSIGRWEEDTLVVDTRFFADHRNPMMGDFPSGPARHVIERYTLSEDGTYATAEMLVEDPDYLEEPLKFELILRSEPNVTLQSFDCDPEIARRFIQ